MARLPNLDKDQLKPEDLKFYDVIATVEALVLR